MIFVIVKYVLYVILICALLFVFAGFIRTWMMEHSSYQAIFQAGKLPDPLPDGFYEGTVPGHATSWLGKTFNASSSTGINVFADKDGTKNERYGFVTYVQGGDVRVLNIDYDLAANPFWLRPVLDEIVETAPGRYLGKLELRIVPGFPFTVLYFELSKPSRS